MFPLKLCVSFESPSPMTCALLLLAWSFIWIWPSWGSQIWLVPTAFSCSLSQFFSIFCFPASAIMCWCCPKFCLIFLSFYVPMSWPMTVIFIASVITNTYFSSLWFLWWTSNPHYHSSSVKTLFFFMILYHLGRFDSLSTLTGILSLFLP